MCDREPPLGTGSLGKRNDTILSASLAFIRVSRGQKRAEIVTAATEQLVSRDQIPPDLVTESVAIEALNGKKKKT